MNRIKRTLTTSRALVEQFALLGLEDLMAVILQVTSANSNNKQGK